MSVISVNGGKMCAFFAPSPEGTFELLTSVKTHLSHQSTGQTFPGVLS